MQMHPLAAIAVMESDQLQREISGTDQLKDEISLIDLGFHEKRTGQAIQLVDDRAIKILALRQHCALLRILDRPVAYCNRAKSRRALLSHPALTERTPPRLEEVK